MKSRIIWLVVVVAAMAGFYYTTIRPMLKPANPPLNRHLTEAYRPPEVEPPPLPAPKIDMPVIPLPLPAAFALPPAALEPRQRSPASSQPEVPIQNGATIDFTYGAPMIRSQGEDQAALDRALKEMAEATKDVTFPPAVRK